MPRAAAKGLPKSTPAVWGQQDPPCDLVVYLRQVADLPVFVPSEADLQIDLLVYLRQVASSDDLRVKDSNATTVKYDPVDLQDKDSTATTK